jgi:heme a synthase
MNWRYALADCASCPALPVFPYVDIVGNFRASDFTDVTDMAMVGGDFAVNRRNLCHPGAYIALTGLRRCCHFLQLALSKKQCCESTLCLPAALRPRISPLMDIALTSTRELPVTRYRPEALIKWLMCIAALVFAMVVVGGITRLTESGLSITEWKPITGALPPLSDAAWALEFEKYKQIPEYTQINGPAGMTLAEFKFIYFWEWVHRLLGRVVGAAFALPLAWFWVKRAIPAGYKPRLLALMALGGLQGTIGWWMVSSGLSARTDVSHYRLAVHLLTALFILGGLVWTALDLKLLARNPDAKPAKLTGFSVVVLGILFVQLLFGAWVSGLNAGYVSNSWPLMNDRFVPDGIDTAKGKFYALVNDPFLTHFVHRWWAWVAVIALIMLARRTRAAGVRSASLAIHSAFGVQILLGIATVMTGVNIVLAVSHQAVGALLVAATVWGVHVLGRQYANG